MDRRFFLKMGLTAGAAGAMGSVAPFPIIKQAFAATPVFTDYKAVVCISLHGGNDSINMLIPTSNSGGGSGYHHDIYAGLRSAASLAVNNIDLNIAGALPIGGQLAKGIGNPYYTTGGNGSLVEQFYRNGVYNLAASKGIPLGVNGLMPELARLITDNKASVIANTGTLVEPMSKIEFNNKTKQKPLFLFAHNHQRRAIDTGIGNNLSTIGWAGRLGDDWGNVNSNPDFGLNYAFSSTSRMQVGRNSSAQVLTTGSPKPFQGMDILKVTNAKVANRRAVFKALFNIPTADPFQRLYNETLNSSMSTIDVLRSNWPTASSFSTTLDSYGNPLFTIPDMLATGFDYNLKGDLINQLKTVAEMIRIGRDVLGLKRQFFTVQLGGFDNHKNQIANHPALLRELSIALYQFQLSMESMNAANQVVSYTVSDFGRTAMTNSSGTDHAWGSQQLVVGGDGTFNSILTGGGKMIGTLPDLTPGGLDDSYGNGRMIPTIATDQYAGTIMRWYGVDNLLMPTVFPNLSNFGTLDIAGTPLGSAYLPLI